jgi:hypothetical protein
LAFDARLLGGQSMSTRKKRGIPVPLENVRGRFQAWRRTRKVRTRIPDPLWAAAVKMAGKYGIHQTAKTLRIDYYGLKRRVEEEAVSSSDAPAEGSVATFVELAGPLPAGCGECVVELEDADGAKMRVHFNGVEAPDLVALSRSFWGMPS